MQMASRVSWGAQLAVVLSLGLVSIGCSDDRGDDTEGGGISQSGPTLGSASASASATDGMEESSTDDSMSSGDPKLDQGNSGMETDGIPCGEGELCECEIPPHTPCDGAPNVPLSQAIGLNCPGETPQVQFTTDGAAAGMGTRTNFGVLNAFPAQEGSQFVVIGSGPVADLDTYDPLSSACSQDLGAFDPLTLPPPLVGMDVGAQTCAENPALIGMGDCSNTIEAQLSGTVNDYTELRITATAPETINSFSYNLAYFSYEYPEYYLSVFNDMYIGWLESEVWTGNISFDENGAPISLNAGFLDYRDATALNDPMCANGCTAQELHGTCMQGHAGTKWLTTSAGVRPGETFTLALAIFDMSDSILDSYAFIDNFEWGCDGDVPPSTTPIE